MEQKRALYTLNEWNFKAVQRLVMEPSFHPQRSQSGIGCPSLTNLRRGPCGTHVWDYPGYVYQDGRKKKYFRCPVCHYEGIREVGFRVQEGN